MVSASTKTKCVHPWGKICPEFDHYDDEIFVWCRSCRKVIQWCDDMSKRRIPYSWPDEAKELAHKLSGFKIEQDPDTKINITIDNSLTIDSNLSNILKQVYTPTYISQMKQLSSSNFTYRVSGQGTFFNIKKDKK